MFRSVEYGGTASMATCWRWDWYKRENCQMPVWQVDGFGNILFCCHGLKFLKSEEIAAKYPNKFLQVYLLCLLDHYLPWDLIAAWREEDLCVQHLVQPTRDLSARLPHWFLPDEQKLQGVSGPSMSNLALLKYFQGWRMASSPATCTCPSSLSSKMCGALLTMSTWRWARLREV